MKLSVSIESFTPRRSNTLYGFVAISVSEMRLKISDLTVHEKNGSRWIGLPGKPILDRDGNVRRDDRGKVVYTPILEFTDRETRTAFSDRVIAALLEFNPGAFDDEAVA